MKKIYATAATILALSIGLKAQSTFWTATNYKGAFPISDNTQATDWTSGWANFDPENISYPATTTTVSTNITSNTTWSGVILLKNKVYVKNGATLTIAAGTIIRGDDVTLGTLIITRGSKIYANGTAAQPIVFTSNFDAPDRTAGDWGGLVILGAARNNQPGGIANIEGIAPTTDTEFGGSNDADNSGVLTYVRVEFAGIALQPNKEINGLTLGSVGSGTTIDNVQVSFSGDDSFEWFGGTVDCKHLIAYRGLDDDFDTDYGYRGRVQFGLAIRDKDASDAAGDSNGFESDNDATGSLAQPLTQAIFSNITLVGPKANGSTALPIGEKFEKAFRIRRNSSLSIFNTLVTGWEKGLSVEGASTEDNFTGDTANFASNVLSNFSTATKTVTAAPSFYASFFGADNNDSTTTVNNIAWVNAFGGLGTTPDMRLTPNSTVATGAQFPTSVFKGGFVGVDKLNATTMNKVSIYPNPASNSANISLTIETASVVTITLYDLLGNTLLTIANSEQLSVGTQTISVNTSTIANGTYYILSTVNGISTTQKLVVNN
jgi:hypothetical protein